MSTWPLDRKANVDEDETSYVEKHAFFKQILD